MHIHGLVKDGGSAYNPEDYGYNTVKYVLTDEQLYLDGDTTQMTFDDYYLNYLTYTKGYSDATYDETNKYFRSTSNVTYLENETLDFYAKLNGSGEWTKVASYNLYSDEITYDENYVAEFTRSKLTFKTDANATAWKIETTNKHYYTSIYATPSYTLKSSDYVMEKIKDKDVINVRNNILLQTYNSKNSLIATRSDYDRDYARVTYRDSDIHKKDSRSIKIVLSVRNIQ